MFRRWAPEAPKGTFPTQQGGSPEKSRPFRVCDETDDEAQDPVHLKQHQKHCVSVPRSVFVDSVSTDLSPILQCTLRFLLP